MIKALLSYHALSFGVAQEYTTAEFPGELRQGCEEKSEAHI
jgi:hypothetical protein